MAEDRFIVGDGTAVGFTIPPQPVPLDPMVRACLALERIAAALEKAVAPQDPNFAAEAFERGMASVKKLMPFVDDAIAFLEGENRRALAAQKTREQLEAPEETDAARDR